jgi:hypothetical protein
MIRPKGGNAIFMMLGLSGSNRVAAIGSIAAVLGGNHIARVERQFATDDGRNERRRRAP